MRPLYRYKTIKHKTADTLKRSATQVLYEKMIFYDVRAVKLYNEIRKKLRQEGAPVAIFSQMAKYMEEANSIAIECAAKLAPYQSPKLQSMEVNKKVTHRFVVQAPKQIDSSSEWLAQVDGHKTLLLNGTVNEITDIQENK